MGPVLPIGLGQGPGHKRKVNTTDVIPTKVPRVPPTVPSAEKPKKDDDKEDDSSGKEGKLLVNIFVIPGINGQLQWHSFQTRTAKVAAPPMKR